MANASNSRTYLATEPLGKLMAKLAVPSIVAQLVNLLYSMVDRIFIGHIPGYGTDALTGLGICLPLTMVISAFAAFAANGGAPLSSMALGAGKREEAQRIMVLSQTLLVIFTVVMMVVSYVFMPLLLPLCGASESTLPYAQSYLSIYLIGTIFVMANLGLSMYLLAQGNSAQMLVANCAGAVIHVGLDALFILVLGWGISGAAISSIFSQGVCAITIIVFLRRPTSAFRFQFKLIVPDWKTTRKIFSVGSGRFFIMATEGLLFGVLNSVLQMYGGDVYVGAMTICSSILTLILTPIQGFTQGTQTIVSFCYGARKIERVRKAAKWIVIDSFVLSFCLVGVTMLFPEAFAHLFSDNVEVVHVAVSQLGIFLFGMMFFGIQLGLQSVFMGLGRGMCSLVVAFVRKIVLFIPLAIILPMFMGAEGVFLSEPISDFLSIAFCSTLFACTIPRMLRRTEAESTDQQAA